MTTKCCHDLVIFKENRQVVGNCDNVARGDSPRFWGRTIMGGLLRHPPYLGVGRGRKTVYLIDRVNIRYIMWW